MKAHATSPYIQHIPLHALVTYMRKRGWESVMPYKRGIQVFQGPLDLNGDPLEIVLPTEDNGPDREMYLASALNLLSALEDRTPEHLAAELTPPPKDARLRAAAQAVVEMYRRDTMGNALWHAVQALEAVLREGKEA